MLLDNFGMLIIVFGFLLGIIILSEKPDSRCIDLPTTCEVLSTSTDAEVGTNVEISHD